MTEVGPWSTTGGDGAGDGWTAEWAVQPVTATAAANTTAVMILAGRMATSLQGDDPVGPGHQRGRGRSQPGVGRALRQVRNGLDPAAIVAQNEHTAHTKRCAQPLTMSTVSPGGMRLRVPGSLVERAGDGLVRPRSLGDAAGLQSVRSARERGAGRQDQPATPPARHPARAGKGAAVVSGLCETAPAGGAGRVPPPVQQP